jgi:hypothetical protein
MRKERGQARLPNLELIDVDLILVQVAFKSRSNEQIRRLEVRKGACPR